MRIVSVIIPFYQRESGILRRALVSVLAQALPEDVRVEVIVVDDGSPLPAAGEIEGLTFEGAFALTLITQPNGGVAVARNTALAAVSAQTEVIAFLDSDDVWLAGHVATGLQALASGYDFYFCDNTRPGHHASHFAAGQGLILPYLQREPDALGFIALAQEEAFSLVLRAFPCQVSTTLFLRAVAPSLIFEPEMKEAGEDLVFFLKLVMQTRKVGFSPRAMVSCEEGINLYFSTIGWDSPGYLKRILADTRSRMVIAAIFQLNPADAAWNNGYIATHRRKAAYHTLRHLARKKRIPEELCTLARSDKRVLLWLPYYLLQVSLGKALGLYRPQ